MHLIIDGYNLLYVNRSLTYSSALELQRERDHLIDQLSAYHKLKQWDITVVFDGWQKGWSTEKKERRKGIEIIFSRMGEKADEVIKRLVKEKGSGAMVVTSDREISTYAERMAVAVVSSDQFKEKITRTSDNIEKVLEKEEEEERGQKRKGPSRRLSKREKRKLAALKKL